MARFQATLQLTRSRRVRQEDGSLRRTEEAVIEIVELVLDEQAIMRELGTKALHSKQGKATALHGLVVVKVKR